MTDNKMSRGFSMLSDADGYRINYEMPEPLRGLLDAHIQARGALLDGTKGEPLQIAGRLGMDSSLLVAPLQVHGTAISECRRIWALPQRVNADGLHIDPAFDASAELTASLRFADCVPILIASHRPHAWAIALHSGFKGTLYGIIRSAWERIANFYGEPDPKDIFVWIGPAIGACCYTRKMSDALAQRALAEWGSETCRIDGELVHLDLIGQIKKQASGLGVLYDNIYTLDSCTSCSSDKFYSYRSGDTDDRMILLAKLKPQTIALT